MPEHQGIRLVAADQVPIATVWRSFVDGFQGYLVPVQIDEPAFVRMITAEDVDLSASLVALDATGAHLGMALLAIRGSRSWCGGLGVVPSARRGGLGRRLMEALIANARWRSSEVMLLECIDGNVGARALYDSLGYQPVRRLDIFDGAPSAEPPPVSGLAGWPVHDPTSLWDDFAAYHAIPKPWQIDESALRTSTAGQEVEAVAVGDRSRPDAYVMFRRPAQPVGRLVVVDAGCMAGLDRPSETLAHLAASVAAAHPGATLAASNISEDEPLNAAMQSLGVPVRISQTEMALTLH